jgi:hypothetical protein
MKIHMRPLPPPVLPAPPPKAPPTLFQLEMKAGELIETAQQQRARLKKLYGARKHPQDTDEDTESETPEQNKRAKRNFDFFA